MVKSTVWIITIENLLKKAESETFTMIGSLGRPFSTECKWKVKNLHSTLTQMTWFYNNFSSLILSKWWNKSLLPHRQINWSLNKWDMGLFCIINLTIKNLLSCPLAHLSSIHYIKEEDSLSLKYSPAHFLRYYWSEWKMSHYSDSLTLNKNDTAACLTHGSCFPIIQGLL